MKKFIKKYTIGYIRHNALINKFHLGHGLGILVNPKLLNIYGNKTHHTSS